MSEPVKKYRKRQTIIEAARFTQKTKGQVYNWITCNKAARFSDDGDPELRIQTLEGVMIARLGDYVVKGIKGEFYPCKPDIFEALHEEADNE